MEKTDICKVTDLVHGKVSITSQILQFPGPQYSNISKLITIIQSIVDESLNKKQLSQKDLNQN